MKSLYEELGGTYRQVGDYFIPHTNRSTVPLPWQKPGGMFQICWMNMRKNPAQSGNDFAIISRSNRHPARKRKTGIDNFLSST